MSGHVQSTPAQVRSGQTQRIENTLALMAPRWTTWAAQTLAQQADTMRVREVASALPFISESDVSKRLAQMHIDGLVTRAGARHGAPYQLSRSGRMLSPVYGALSDWSQANLPLGEMAGAERVEDALRRLRLRHSTAVIQLLDTNGPMHFVHLVKQTELDDSLVAARLKRLQADGLVTRSGTHHRDAYVLTNAGQTLGPVYAAVDHWSSSFDPQHRATPAIAAATRTRTGMPHGSDGIRTAAALGRTTTAPGGLFSHAPLPQPRVPTAVTTQSAPSRGR